MSLEKMGRALSALAVVILSGCANGYQQYYRPNTSLSPETVKAFRVAPPPAVPFLERASPGSPSELTDAYARRGYVVVGFSSFNSGKEEPVSNALRQGSNVGADLVVVIDPRYTGSVTSTVPITTPTSSTSYSTGRATAFGPGGAVTAYGSGSTTTYGSTTSYIPVTVDRSDYTAVFFVRQKLALGVFGRDLNDKERQEYQTNRGAIVRIVANGTPAFNADILPGDLIQSIDRIQVQDSRQLSQLLAERHGQIIQIALLRGGFRLEKQVLLGE